MEPAEGDLHPGFGTSHGPKPAFILHPLPSADSAAVSRPEAGQWAALQWSDQMSKITNSFICNLRAMQTPRDRVLFSI